MSIRFLLFSLIIISFTDSFCQENKKIFIQGSVQDRTTHTPIAYANINLIGTNFGTASDANGNFYLSVDEKFADKIARISCLGYNSSEASLNELNKTTILLSPATITLDEVSVNANGINAKEIVTQAIKNVNLNYVQKPFNVEYFSEFVVADGVHAELSKTESILLGYSTGYISAGKRKFEILQARISGTDPFQGFKIPSQEIYVTDVIANPLKFGIFNVENFSSISFSYKGSTIFDKDTVYIIDYTIDKITKKNTGYGVLPLYYKGTVSIATHNYAIVKHQIETDRFTYKIIYKQYDKYYFPYLIEGNRMVTNGKENTPYVFSNRLSLLNITTTDAKPVAANANETDFSKVKFDKAYWDNNFPVTKK